MRFLKIKSPGIKPEIQYNRDEFLAFFLSTMIWFTPFRTVLIEVGNSILPGSGILLSRISILLFLLYILLPIRQWFRPRRDGLLILLFILLQWLRSFIFHLDFVSDWIAGIVEFLLKVFPYYFIAREVTDWSIVKRKLYASGIPTVLMMLGMTCFLAVYRGYLFSNETASYSMFLSFLIGRTAVILLIAFCDTKRLKYVLFFVVSVGLLIMYGSRTPLVCIALTVVIYLAAVGGAWIKKGLAWLKRRSVKLLAVFVVIVIGGMVWVQSLQGQVMTSVNPGNRIVYQIINGSFFQSSGRLEIYKVSVKLIGEHPVFGTGIFADRLLITEGVGFPIKGFMGNYPHNFILEMLLQFGIPVGLVVLLLIAYFCWQGMFHTLDMDMWWIYLYAIGFGIGSMMLSFPFTDSMELMVLLGMGMQSIKISSVKPNI